MQMNAKKFTGNNYDEIIDWIIPQHVIKSHRLDTDFMVLYTNDEAIIVNIGDYIVIDKSSGYDSCIDVTNNLNF